MSTFSVTGVTRSGLEQRRNNILSLNVSVFDDEVIESGLEQRHDGLLSLNIDVDGRISDATRRQRRRSLHRCAVTRNHSHNESKEKRIRCIIVQQKESFA